MCQLGDSTRQLICVVHRKSTQETLRFAIDLDLPDTKLGVGLVNGAFPLSIQTPAHRDVVKLHNVPNVYGQYRIATHKGQGREKIDSQELEPEFADRMIGIWRGDDLLGLWIMGDLTITNNEQLQRTNSASFIPSRPCKLGRDEQALP